MARVPMLEKDQAHPIMQDVYKKFEDEGREVANLFKVLAHSPKIGRDVRRLGVSILFKGEVPPKLRELAILRVGNLAKANYEWTHHVRIALQIGVTQDQIDEIKDWSNSTRFDERERAVLRYTDEVTQNYRVSDDAFSDLRNFFSEQEMVELTATIGYYGMVCRILEALQVDLEH